MSKQTGKTAGIYERIRTCKNAKTQKCKNVKVQMFVYAFALLFICVCLTV